ncbi:MAG: SDR family NAD(P)-dependent oxidoreductase [Actinomycetota bacterium]|nr:SDR family NAD(P)-dependent oxidoreductase [Actinomycetota bacterium]
MGASSGIGLQTALCYAERGARLVLAARSLGALQDAEEQCLQAGAAATLVAVTDVVEPARVAAMLEAAMARFGQVDVAVGCVGVAAFGRFEDVPAEVFEAVVRTNVIGTANLARSVLAHFRLRQRGTLVIVGSLLGQVTVPYLSSYVVSKFAVTALARVLRQETRDLPGVRIHEIRPGGVNTPLYVRAANYAGRAGRPPPPVDDPATIATAILRSVDNGREDVSIGLANPVLLLGFRLFPAVFDVVVGPLMRLTGLSRQRIDPNPGNVFEPRPGPARARGRWHSLR